MTRAPCHGRRKRRYPPHDRHIAGAVGEARRGIHAVEHCDRRNDRWRDALRPSEDRSHHPSLVVVIGEARFHDIAEAS
jgi:hypothetical protein